MDIYVVWLFCVVYTVLDKFKLSVTKAPED